MKKKLLVCGSTGFIGRNVAEFFSNNTDYDVYGTYFSSEPFNHPKIKFIKADLTRKEEVDAVVKGMNIIIQAAATTSGAKDIINKPYYHVTDNALMNSLLLRSSYENNVEQFVFFSCTVMYQPGEDPVKEMDFNANDEIYQTYFGVGWTKVYIEKMCEFFSRIGSTKYTVLRHSNIYGPYDKYDLEKSHVFGATLTKVITNKDGQIVVWGTGETARDLLYVSDLVRAVELTLQEQISKFEIFNIGYGQSISVTDLVSRIILLSGKKLNVVFDTTKPDIKTKLCLNCSRAEEILKWTPKVTLDHGILKTIEWYNQNILST